jgi:predicted RNA binding protein YcfA (HicA-like mRNA interferase family)
MNYTGKHLRRVALKLGFTVVEGKKHMRVYDAAGRYVSTLPRGIIKPGTLRAILKQMGLSKAQLSNLI